MEVTVLDMSGRVNCAKASVGGCARYHPSVLRQGQQEDPSLTWRRTYIDSSGIGNW